MPLQIDTTNMLLTNSSYNFNQIISQNESINKILTLIENYLKTENFDELINNLPLLIEKLNLLVAMDIRFINI